MNRRFATHLFTLLAVTSLLLTLAGPRTWATGLETGRIASASTLHLESSRSVSLSKAKTDHDTTLDQAPNPTQIAPSTALFVGSWEMQRSAAFSCAEVTEIPQAECEALVALYNSTNGPNWSSNTGWLVTNTPCAWAGIDCSMGHVVRLDLGSNQLSGPIPAELGNLANLTWLNLSSLTMSHFGRGHMFSST